MYKIKYIFPLFLFFFSTLYPQNNRIILLKADCAVHPPLAEYIEMGILKANELKAECLILELNTPGGLLTSTRKIVQEFLRSETSMLH